MLFIKKIRIIDKKLIHNVLSSRIMKNINIYLRCQKIDLLNFSSLIYLKKSKWN